MAFPVTKIEKQTRNTFACIQWCERLCLGAGYNNGRGKLSIDLCTVCCFELDVTGDPVRVSHDNNLFLG